jgi:amidase
MAPRPVHWLVSAYGTLFNYTGHPAIVLPYRIDGDGLPIGLQIAGRRWDDSRLLGVAKALSPLMGGFQRSTGLLTAGALPMWFFR